MILKFSAKNFYSFKDFIEVSFEVNDNAPDTNAYVKSLDGARTSKVLSVIGPNASGKTNLLKILTFIHYLICHSYTNLKPEEELPFSQYHFVTRNSAVSEIAVTFQLKETLFEYLIKLNEKQIFEERLRKFNKVTKQFSVLYSRKWNIKQNKFDYSLRNFNFSERLSTKRKNATLLAIAAQSEHKLSKEILNYWNHFTSNVSQGGREDNTTDELFEAAEYYKQNSAIHTKVNSLLSKFDLGLSGTEIEEFNSKTKGGKEETMYLPYGIHKVAGKDYPLPFIYESRGTQNLFVLLRQILPILNDGGIVVLDEFDADLHPAMLPELVNMFASRASNPKNAQLIFSTHHHEILNKLDKYQIVLVEKNNETGITEAFRLDEVKGVRADDNYYMKYLAGAYGAVPEI